MNQLVGRCVIVVSLLVGLPLVGILLTGKPLEQYLEFPPRTRYVQHEPFSWPVFVGLAVFILSVISPFVFRISSFVSRLTFREIRFTVRPFDGSTGSPSRAGSRDMLRAPSRVEGQAHRPEPSRGTLHERRASARTFPWWGWVGIGITAVAWVLAWNRFAWFEAVQLYSFTPLWAGYILVVQAWTFARTERCLMLDRPRHFLALFPLSSAFWWFFEYLNRFVQNWSYVGVDQFTPLEYFLHATIPFSTVLPAVLGTEDLLQSFPLVRAGLDRWKPVQIRKGQGIGRGLLLVAACGLIGIGIWPNYLFPLVWVAPLLVITALQMLQGEETIFSPLARGDWRPIWRPALAALICGFFWELWNYKSLAHWEYAVPFVQRFQLFEMPLLGYAGYLPFGLECVVVAQVFLPKWNR